MGGNARCPRILAFGASTGGPQAVATILGLMRRPLNQAIIVVQHMPLGFTASFADRLRRTLDLDVRECKEDGEVIAENRVYVASGGKHLTLLRSQSRIVVRLSDEPADLLHKPSIDILLASLAQLRPEVQVKAALLTGMGRDGARGLRELRDKGGITAVQAEVDCVVYGMPKAALASHAASISLSLEEMAVWASSPDTH